MQISMERSRIHGQTDGVESWDFREWVVKVNGIMQVALG